MSNLEDRKISVDEARAIDARYKAARAKIEKAREVEAGQAGALFFAAMAYGEELERNTLFQKASHAAKLFCIAFAFIVPNVLLIMHLTQ